MAKFDFLKISDSCVKCGKCIQVCTIYDVKREETNSPRGFLDLLGAYSRGDLELDKNAKNIFESCFLCTNCVDVCPNSLRVDEAIERVRSDIADKFGIAFYKRVIFLVFRASLCFKFGSEIGYVFKSCAFDIKKSAGFDAAI